MFEGTQKNDEKNTQRQAVSAGLSFSLVGGVLLALIFFHPEVQRIVQEELPVEVKFFQAAPPPPPPPPPAGGNKTKKKEKKKKKKKKKRKIQTIVEPKIEKEPEEIPEPEEEPEEILDSAITGGQVGGQVGGVLGGQIGGVLGGKLGGILGGKLGGTLGISEVPASRVKVIKKKNPKFPQAAKTLNIKKASCLVRFYIDEKGEPEKTIIQGCASVFHPAVEKAAMQWRFKPMESKSGVGMKATFRLRITFILN
jgi:outer membrane biosynthesis protein TonB